MAASTPLELGMVGLGRMGANLVRRAMRDGHRCAGTDVNADAVRALAERGDDGRGLRGGAGGDARAAAGRLGDGAGGGDHGAGGRRAGHAARARDTVIDGGNTRYHDDIRRARELGERGIHYVDVGTSGGVFGLERGFCLMVGGEDGAGRAPRAALRLARAGPRCRGAHARPHGRPGTGGARLAPLRAGRRGALREDGAQRDRVRADGRVRGGPQPPPPRRRGRRRPRVRRGDRPPRQPGPLPLRPRRGGDQRGLAARERRRLVAARPDRSGAPRVARAGWVRRTGVRLGGGAVDVDRRDRDRHPRPRPHRRALRAVLVTRRGGLREPRALGDAEAVRGHAEKPAG